MTNVFITVDAEWDRISKQKQVTTKNLEEIPRFQELCTKNNIHPIYFCAFETLENNDFVTYLKPYLFRKEIEVGAHLHPWSTPPFESFNQTDNTPFPTQLPLNIFEKKLKLLTEKIQKKFDYKPVSYRAGRFGFSYEHIPILAENGYLIDSSITPLINWKNLHSSAPDYSMFKNPDRTTIGLNNRLLHEFPVTILPNKSYTFKNIIKRILTNYPIWFRIYPTTSFSDLKFVIDYAIKKKIENLTFFMHSNELHYQCNTYFETPGQIKKLYLLLSELFTYMNEIDLNSETFANQIDKK